MTKPHVLVVVLVVTVAVGGPTLAAGDASAAGCSFPVTSTDATGTEVTVQEEPTRIVTLSPSAAQTMWEIGAEQKVVGLTSLAFYLEGAESRTDVWAETSINVEKVIALTPDLVLAPNVIPNETVDQLRRAGLTVYKFETATSTDFIADKTVLTGRLVGACDGARDRANRLRSEVATIREAATGVERPRVLYTFFGWTAGEGTFVDTVITTAGGRNIAAEAGISGYKKISEEVVIDRDPQWIVLNSDNPSVPDSPAYEETTAVKEGNIVTVDANYVSQPAPRIIEPMLTIVQAMHPDAYERAQREIEKDDDDEPAPSFSITSASVNVSRVELHDTARIVYTVRNDGGTGMFRGLFTLNGSVTDIDFAEIDGGSSETLAIEYAFGSWGTHVLRINDRRIGTVTVVKDLHAGAGTPTPDDGSASNGTDSADATEMTPTETATSTSTPTPTPSETSSPGVTEASSPTPTTTDVEMAEQSPGTRTAQPVTPEPTTTRSGGQPGFGVLLLVVAIIAVGMWRRRDP